jgi:hypothetical protein
MTATSAVCKFVLRFSLTGAQLRSAAQAMLINKDFGAAGAAKILIDPFSVR